MKKLPKRVRVNHLTYSISEREEIVVRDGNDVISLAIIDYLDREIHIAENNQHKQKSLLHEIIHAIDYAAGHTLQEAEVSMLAIGLCGVMRDNPKIKEYIFDDG